jgi:uncharacterized phage protein (TIGR02220 family)
MPVFRVNHNGNYTVMSNFHLRDRTLSLKAKGLLSVMLSLPKDWDYTIAGLAKISKEGTHAITSTLNELKDHGYLCVTKVAPKKGESHVYSYVYDVFETPQIAKDQIKQGYGFQPLDEQHLDCQAVDEQDLDNRMQLNTNKKVGCEPIRPDPLFAIGSDSDRAANEESSKEDKSFDDAVRVIVGHLNSRSGKAFLTSTKKTRSLIKSRFKEGHTVDDFIKVIDIKVSEWEHDRTMAKYIRPNTLFGDKFDCYLNQSGSDAPSEDYSIYD